MIPDGLRLRFRRGSWPEPPIFDLLRRTGEVPEPEMLRTFNLGVGLVLALAPAEADVAIATLAERGVGAWKVGEVLGGAGGERVVFEA